MSNVLLTRESQGGTRKAELAEIAIECQPPNRRKLSTILLETGENSAIRARQQKKILQ
jgi:hypothetical protein